MTNNSAAVPSRYYIDVDSPVSAKTQGELGQVLRGIRTFGEGKKSNQTGPGSKKGEVVQLNEFEDKKR